MKHKILIFLLTVALFVGGAISEEIPCQAIKIMGLVNSTEGPVQEAIVRASINGQMIGGYISDPVGQYVILITDTEVMNESTAQVNLTATKGDKTGSIVITVSCNETKEGANIMIFSQGNKSPSIGEDTNAEPGPGPEPEPEPEPEPGPVPPATTPAVEPKTTDTAAEIKPKPSEKGLTIITSPSRIKSDERIEIQVKYQNNTIPNAKVTILLPNGNTLDEKTGENGTLVTRLQAGDATINVEANGMTASKKITVEGGGFPYLWILILIIIPIILISGYVIFKRMQ